MKKPWHSFSTLRDAIDIGTPPAGYLVGAEHRISLGDLLQGSAIASGALELRGRSVLIASADQFLTALALIELDGPARRNMPAVRRRWARAFMPARSVCPRSGFCSPQGLPAGPRWCCIRWPA